MLGDVSLLIAMFLVTSPIVINVPTRGLLAVETMHAIVQSLANLNIKRSMTSMFVNKKHRYGREFKKTTTATAMETSLYNTLREQYNGCARAL